MKVPISFRSSFAGSFLAFLTLAGGIATGLGQDLAALRKERVAVLEQAVTWMTNSEGIGLTVTDSIVSLRSELLQARLDLDLPRDQRLIFLKEAAQDAREFEKVVQARYRVSIAPESRFLLAKAGRLEIEIRLLEMKDNTAGLPQNLETLRKTRVETLEKAVVQLTEPYSRGFGGIEPVMQARIELLKSRLAPGLSQEKKTTLVEKAIQQTRTFEKSVQDSVAAGLVHQSDALVTEAGLLGMEIQLLMLKGKSGKPAHDAEVLRKKRVATLERIVAMLTDGYSEGVGGIEQILSCQIELLETQSELDLPRIQKIAILGETLKRARDYENLMQARVNAGISSSIELFLAKAGRLKIEIRLLEMKALGAILRRRPHSKLVPVVP